MLSHSNTSLQTTTHFLSLSYGNNTQNQFSASETIYSENLNPISKERYKKIYSDSKNNSTQAFRVSAHPRTMYYFPLPQTGFYLEKLIDDIDNNGVHSFYKKHKHDFKILKDKDRSSIQTYEQLKETYSVFTLYSTQQRSQIIN